MMLTLAVILLAAKLAGHVAVRLRQPAVLGELLAGVAIGQVGLPHPPSVLAELGVVLLLFEVGLESTVRDMLKVGWVALAVALLGVVTPFALGWGVAVMLLRDAPATVPVFVGAALTATSVGITARVLKDLGRSQTLTARIILGAAVIDDVLGLVILAAVGGIISAGTVSVGTVSTVIGKAALFLFAALALGTWLSPRLLKLAAKLQGGGVLLASALVVCFAVAAAAEALGLAAIVGAYAAGLILEDVHFHGFNEERQLEDLLRPLTSFLAPVFFVVMGMKVDLKVFADPSALMLAGALTAAAIAGKLVCALPARRLAVGLGMIPRGEVGLIFANIGVGLGVVDARLLSAIVIMVIVTTLVTPPLLASKVGRDPGG